MVNINGLRYERSTKADKKLQVWVGGKWIHFGQKGYEHFHDKTNLLPKSWNHKDPVRRRQYLARASKIRNRQGKLTVNDVNSPNYHAIRILW